MFGPCGMKIKLNIYLCLLLVHFPPEEISAIF